MVEIDCLKKPVHQQFEHKNIISNDIFSGGVGESVVRTREI